MADGRSGFTATRLDSGQVLVVGGTNDSAIALPTAERY